MRLLPLRLYHTVWRYSGGVHVGIPLLHVSLWLAQNNHESRDWLWLVHYKCACDRGHSIGRSGGGQRVQCMIRRWPARRHVGGWRLVIAAYEIPMCQIIWEPSSDRGYQLIYCLHTYHKFQYFLIFHWENKINFYIKWNTQFYLSVLHSLSYITVLWSLIIIIKIVKCLCLQHMHCIEKPGVTHIYLL